MQNDPFLDHLSSKFLASHIYFHQSVRYFFALYSLKDHISSLLTGLAWYWLPIHFPLYVIV